MDFDLDGDLGLGDGLAEADLLMDLVGPEDTGLIYNTRFGAEARGRRKPDKGAAEKNLADTLRAVGHKDADADAEAVSQAVGGNAASIRNVTKGVRVAHHKRGGRKGNVDLTGIVGRRARKAAGKFESVHAKHKRDRDAATKKLRKALEKKGHKHADAARMAALAATLAGSDLTAQQAFANAVLAAPSGPAFNVGQTFGSVYPGFAQQWQQLARQGGVFTGPPAPPTGLLGGLFGAGTGPSGDKLMAGQSLSAGQSMMSSQSITKLTMGGDGTVTLTDPTRGNRLIWSITEARGVPGTTLAMQADGQLVIRDVGGNIRWTSAQSVDTKSGPVAGAYLLVQNDGNLVVYDPQSNALWTPMTYKKFGRHPQRRPPAMAAPAAAATPYAAPDTLPDQYLSAMRPDVSPDMQPGDDDTGDAGQAADGGDAAPAAPSDEGGAAVDSGDDAATAAPADSGDAGAQAQPADSGGGDAAQDASQAAPQDASQGDGTSPASGDVMGCEDDGIFAYETPFSLKG